jgi:hypothetical protein
VIGTLEEELSDGCEKKKFSRHFWGQFGGISSFINDHFIAFNLFKFFLIGWGTPSYCMNRPA